MINYSKILQKEYKFKIYSPFLKAIKEYNLIKENDKIGVCISGGKDSFLMALCFKELLKHSDFPFEVKYMLMDPGYKENDLNSILENAKKLDIDLHIFKTNIYKISKEQENNKCYICAKMRRGALYNEAKKLGLNKIALGHHFNDAIETLLMSILYSGEIGGMRPIVKSDNYDDMYLIRPMYYVKEESIIDYSKTVQLEFLKCACFLTENSTLCESSKRQIVKKLIKELDTAEEYVSKNIMTCYNNVNLNKLNKCKYKGKNLDLINGDNDV